ncbi:MAG: VOC family protein [candidate division NC10 bacterium]|nr:VOC family protein [candidate division NC10 bacterium]
MPAYRARLGHTHLKVRSLPRAVDFYTRVFGLRVVEEVGGDYAFLSGEEAHHEIALQEVGAGAPAPPPHGVGLYHVAFEVPDRRAFALAYRTLHDAGVPVATVDHRISWAIYFADPDGNGLEIYWDTRREKDGRSEWRGASLPLPPAKILSALEEA